MRVEQVSEYQAIVDAEWEIIFHKLQAIERTGAKVVLSKLPIGVLATQWFADIFCAPEAKRRSRTSRCFCRRFSQGGGDAPCALLFLQLR